MSAQGGGLAESIYSSVERALALSGRRDPRVLSEAMAPIIGAAIRKSVVGSIRRSFLWLNRTVLRYASFTGLRWRIEARREGKPFSVVFLERTRSMPVKQVFLIHRETGILLQQAQNEVDTSQDWDVVSGMLTALGDFIHDSFSVGRDEQLETIRVGAMTIVVEQGKHAALAGILRGEAPPDLRDRFRSVLDQVHMEFSRELEVFTGETSVFDKSSSFLESCLQALVNTDQSRILPQTWLLAALLPILLGTWGGLAWHDHWSWSTFVDEVEAQPGIVVMQSGKHNGRRFIYGLRDAAAPDPARILSEHGYFIAEVDSRWAPYQAMPETLTLQRLRDLLKPPDSISLELEGGVLVARGAASQDWLDSTLARLKSLAGLVGYRTDGVVITDVGDIRRWESFVQRLEGEPGIVVLRSERRDGRFRISGLRDPLAREPSTLMAPFGLSPGDVDSRWEPYQALHPTLVLERARQTLNPPAGVTLDLRDGILFAEGQASYKWITWAQTVARSVAGVKSLNTEKLADEDLAEVQAVQGLIEKSLFRFLVGAPDLWPGQGGELEALTANVTRLQRAAARRGQRFVVEIRGHTESTGDARRDLAESGELANTFYENLRWRGADLSLFTKHGMGSVQPQNAGAVGRESNNRLVSFKVLFEGT